MSTRESEKLAAMGMGPPSPALPTAAVRKPYDIEAGSALSTSAGAARSLRRALTRRVRLALLGLGSVLLIIYLMSPADEPSAPALSGQGGKEKGGLRPKKKPRPRPVGGAPAPDKLKPVGGARPAPAPPPNLEVDMVHDVNHTDYFVLDENGDRFLPNVVQAYAPLHPNEGDYRAAERLFSEIDEDFLKPVAAEPFPASRMREIVSEPPPNTDKVTPKSLPKDAFALKWQGPANWNKPGPGTKPIQWKGFKGKKEWETPDEKETREGRRAAVKRSFIYAWQKYKTYAWGHDEVKPVSMEQADPFNG